MKAINKKQGYEYEAMNNSTRHLLETFIVSTAELSALTGIPMITIQKWVERGQVDCVKKGRTYLFDRRDFPSQTPTKADTIQ